MKDAENLDRLEERKLQREIEKIEAETRALGRNQIRSWLTTISLIVGIGASVVSVIGTMTEIQNKNRQLAIEAQIRSHQIFLVEVLDRVAGVKTVHYKHEGGQLVATTSEGFAPSVQVGAYAVAFSLANEFPSLRTAVTDLMEYKLKLGEDSYATEILSRISGLWPE
ncbi:MAG: hypothetical protein GY725_04820 [bacterium]|nr:hypothetical protein [bacterium]